MNKPSGATAVERLADLAALVGTDVGVSDWKLIDPDMQVPLSPETPEELGLVGKYCAGQQGESRR